MMVSTFTTLISSQGGASLNLEASVNPAAIPGGGPLCSNTLTGQVSFYNNSTLLGTVSLGSDWTASISVPSSLIENGIVSAKYLGIPDPGIVGQCGFSPSLSNSIPVSGGFTPPPPSQDTEPPPGISGGDNRVLWGFESPAYTWATSGLEFKLKHLKGGELWVDKVYGVVNITVQFREDADPCWRNWFVTSVCAARDCTEVDPVCAYPDGVAFREGYRYPVVFPEPHPACDSMGVRPSTIGYQFQVKIMLRGWCRVRGLLLYAMPHTEPQYHGIAQPPEMGVISGGLNTTGMTKLPNPFNQP